MIKFIHNNTKVASYVLLFIALCFALSGVIVDNISSYSSRGRYAVKVNEKEFSFADFKRAEERIEAQYRQMLGKNYSQFAQSLRQGMPQQALDNIVDSYLIETKATDIGFAASNAESSEYIVSKIFGAETPFSADAYRGLLRNTGMPAADFERQVQRDIVRNSLTGLLNDVGFSTQADITSQIVREETKYTLTAFSYSPTTLLPEIADPTGSDLQSFYDKHATEYEISPRVSYEYVIFNPSDYEKEVSIAQSDIELFYADNATRFSEPEQWKVRSIKLLYSKESDPVKMAAVKERAKLAYDDALAQKPFESLVTKYSDDLPSKIVGGARPWMTQVTAPAEYKESVLKTPVGQIAKMIEADYGFEIVKVEEKREQQQKPLDSVKGEIETELRKQESPAFASAKAQDFFTLAKKGNSLSEAVKGTPLILTKTAELLDAQKDPNQELSGLTEQVLSTRSPTSELALIDLGALTVVVKILEFKDRSTPALSEIKDQVTKAFKEEAAQHLAKTKAEELIKVLSKTAENDRIKIATNLKSQVTSGIEISRAKPTNEKLAELSTEISDAVFKSTKPTLIERPFVAPKGSIVISVATVTLPEQKTITDPATVKRVGAQQQQQSQRQFVESVVAQLKGAATVDFEPSILGNS